MGLFDDIGKGLEKSARITGESILNPLFGKPGVRPQDLLNVPGLKGAPGYQENDFVKQQREQLRAMKGPEGLKMEAASQAPTSLPQFEYARRGIQDEANQAEQRQSEAMKRRFASLGALSSGEAIKAEQLARQDVQKAAQKQLGDIGAAEAAQIAQQQMAKEEAVNQRNAQREIYNADAQFKDKIFRFDSESKLAQLDLAFNQDALQRANFENDKLINEFNLQLSKIAAQKKKPGLLGGLFGESGLLGDTIGGGGASSPF